MPSISVLYEPEACRRRRVAFLEPFRAKFSQFIYVKHHVLGNSILHATDDLTDWTFKEWRRIPDYGGKSQLCLATINADGTVSNEVLVDCPDGVVRDPALSLDARRVVFSMRHDMTNDDYHLYDGVCHGPDRYLHGIGCFDNVQHQADDRHHDDHD